MLEVTLRINGEDTTFVSEFVSALHYRKAIELNKTSRLMTVL